MEFKKIAEALQRHLKDMQEIGHLYVVEIDKDELWDLYLSSFPEGANTIFRERREFDCNNCKRFVRQAGAIVVIDEYGELVSVWDAEVPDENMQIVFDRLASHVSSKMIVDEFLHYERVIGTHKNVQDTEDGVVTWHHFAMDVPRKYREKKDRIGEKLSAARTRAQVLHRSLSEISLDSAEIVLDLIDQKSLYRGEEHLKAVESFIAHKKEFDELDQWQRWIYCWEERLVHGIRNTAIGTLLVDLSEGADLDAAVKSFESKVAPANYKRPKALVTKKMIESAEAKVAELGIEESLYRRCARAEDLTANNVLFADRGVRPSMGGVFDGLKRSTPDSDRTFSKLEEVSIEDFVENVLPTAEKVELFLDDEHESNLVSLVAPVSADAPNILQWGNNFTWSYNGDVADSMKSRVKGMGGNVDGVLRFSIQWNENGDDDNDLDAHCAEPCGNRIYYGSKINFRTLGNLDVDIINPSGKAAVENITWPDARRMNDGVYQFAVHCYSGRGGRSGFRAEIEHDGRVWSFNYPKMMRTDETVYVADVHFSKSAGVTRMNEKLKSAPRVREIWGVSTHKFHRVSMMMNSPNHWDGEETGNKHYFFMLEGCKTDQPVRGFYNEYLSPRLHDHRKVFEVLGSRLKAEPDDQQLSGLGFSSTKRASVVCRVSGSFNRQLKITF